MRVPRLGSVVAVTLLSTTAGCGFINDIDGPQGLAIRRFSVSPREVTPGRASTLSWDVDGADSIQIDNGIGVVKATGTLEVKADRTTTYNMTARAAGSTATASVQLVVGAASAASPTPSATPTPVPSPTPTPSSSPTPRPSPSATSACGPSVESVQGCSVTIERVHTLPASECIEITRMALSQGCPLAAGASRAVSFEVMAETELRDLRWRKLTSSRDSLDPSDGRLIRHGATTSIASQTVQEGSLTIEILSEGTPVLTFRLTNH